VPAPSADSCCAPQAGQSSQAQPSRSESQVYQPYQSQPSRIEPEVYHQTQPSRSDSRVYQPYQTQPSRMVTSSSPYAPITSASPYAPIAISCAPCEPEVKPAVSEQKVIVLPALKLDHDTTCTTCTTCPTLEKPVSTTAATAKDDWRQSWD